MWKVGSSGGQPVANYRGHSGRLLCAQWSLTHPDCVYTGADDNTLQTWHVTGQLHVTPPTGQCHSNHRSVSLHPQVSVTPPTGQCHSTHRSVSLHPQVSVTPPTGQCHSTHRSVSLHPQVSVTPPTGQCHSTHRSVSLHPQVSVTPPTGQCHSTHRSVSLHPQVSVTPPTCQCHSTHRSASNRKLILTLITSHKPFHGEGGTTNSCRNDISGHPMGQKEK